MWPVIVRELRAESRRAFNYWVRVLGAGAVLVMCYLIVRESDRSQAETGVKLFGSLNAILFVSIWVLAPLLTADCVSREKREGTLGLLFLTPLRPFAVVAAKSVANVVRGLGLLLAAAPVMAVSLMFGGVTWRECLLAFLLNNAALLLALSAGLLVSTYCRQWVRALVSSVLLSLLLGTLFLLGHAMAQAVANWPSRWSLDRKLTRSLHLATGWDGIWNGVHGVQPQPYLARIYGYGGWVTTWWPTPPTPRKPAAVQNEFLKNAGYLLGISSTLLLLTISYAGRQLKSSWKDEPARQLNPWWHKTFCTPFFWQSFFKTRMRIKLGRNPISWLQQYSWSARLTKWSWCLAIIIVNVWLFVFASFWNLPYWQNCLLGVLSVGMCFSAVASFQQEKESGALELLLVAPLSVRQIILGRMTGIWRQFLPATLLLTAFCIVLVSGKHNYWSYGWVERKMTIWFFLAHWLGVLGTVPAIGLFWALSRANFFASWLMTTLVGLLLPLVCTILLYRGQHLLDWRRATDMHWAQILEPIALPSVLGLIFGIALFYRLKHRRFAYQRG